MSYLYQKYEINFLEQNDNIPFLNLNISLEKSFSNEFNKINRIVNKKKLERKRKSSGEVGIHNEYSEDNLIRKSKNIFSHAFFEFINSKIEKLELYITINNKKNKVEKLLNLGQKITKDLSVNGNLSLFQTPIKNILFEISRKYKKYPKNYNKVAIDELCTNENENYQEIASILNLDYLDCLKYYRRDEIKDSSKIECLKCLNGLELKFDKLPKDLEEEGYDKNYEKELINTLKKIDDIYKQKKSRKKRK